MIQARAESAFESFRRGQAIGLPFLDHRNHRHGTTAFLLGPGSIRGTGLRLIDLGFNQQRGSQCALAWGADEEANSDLKSSSGANVSVFFFLFFSLFLSGNGELTGASSNGFPTCARCFDATRHEGERRV